jgi:hypothetical protein
MPAGCLPDADKLDIAVRLLQSKFIGNGPPEKE